jgi:hypothetical protein
VRCPHLVGLAAFGLAATPIAAAPLPGQITVAPHTAAWLARSDGRSIFICGPGDPEGFLYRGTRNADGTRNGDQMQLIQTLAATSANSIYLIAVRSHGGDGDATQNPFVAGSPSQGLNDAVLDQWETWFDALDDAGIVIFFLFYDDNARVWDTSTTVGAPERSFIRGIVDRFEHHRHLIWCVAEEYSEALTSERASAFAAEIRAADDHDHVIAVHQRTGVSFDFPDDPSIDQFAIQHNVSTAEELHAGMVRAFSEAAGRWQLVMAESAEHGTGASARRKSWACAMGGAYVMVLRMDVATTDPEDLAACGRLVEFMESTDFETMAPRDDLAHGATTWALADSGRSYIAYAVDPAGPMGVKGLRAGLWDIRWFDCATGARVDQLAVPLPAGDHAWPVPALGSEVAVSIRLAPPTPVESGSWADTKARYR